MKTLHFYLARQVLASVMMTVAVFTFVLLLGNGLKEILPLLINRQVTFLAVIQGISLLIPWILLFALPMGMLTATLLVFGRFSADQELTAARASGISLVALVTPVLFLGILFSGLCGWINLQVAPECRVAYKHLLYEVATSNPAGMLRENQYNEFPGGLSVYVRKIKNNDLRDVKVYQVGESGNSIGLITAPTGKFLVRSNELVLTLFDATDTQVQGANVFPSVHFDSVDSTIAFGGSGAMARPTLSEMTFSQLHAQLKKLERSFSRAQMAGTNSPQDLRTELRQLAKIQSDITLPVRVHMHRQVAFSFACFGFTLIGIPLGIRAHRRETSLGVAMSLILVLVYYAFVILAQAWDTRAEFAPHLIVWIPNFIFQIIGGFLLWRANKGIS